MHVGTSRVTARPRAVLLAAAGLAALPAAGLGLLFVTAPGRCSRQPARGVSRLIDQQLPAFDATLVCEIMVDAPPQLTFAAIGETNLLDPVIRGLFIVRELPNRLLRRLGRGPAPAMPRSVTFADLVHPGSGMVVVAEEPGREIVIGSVGRFWEKDYGWHPFAAHEFAGFREPGFAKLAIGFRVEPDAAGGSLLRYEARTATTDDRARRDFARYWWIIRPGVALVMRRALGLIRIEAERRVADRGGSRDPA